MPAQQTSHARPQTAVPAASLPMRRFFIPREHGSWGMWLLPLLTGAAVGAECTEEKCILPVAWFLIAALSAFLAYQPLEVLLSLSPLRTRKAAERKWIILWIVVCLVIGFTSLIQLSRLERGGIIWFALVAVLCFDVRWIFGRTRAFRVSKQVMGALALTSTATGAYYAATGELGRTAMCLWLAFWLFSAAQIEFVQLCIRTASAQSRWNKLLAGRIVLVSYAGLFLAAIVAGLTGFTPALLGLCLVPSLIRIGLWFLKSPRKINFHRLGLVELSQSILFAALLAAVFISQ
jgi:YwiC-like protein